MLFWFFALEVSHSVHRQCHTAALERLAERVSPFLRLCFHRSHAEMQFSTWGIWLNGDTQSTLNLSLYFSLYMCLIC